MSLTEFLSAHVQRTVHAYQDQPDLIREHARMEEEILSGGYGRRQVFELIQNGADAIQESGESGRIQVLLTEENLYCANQGDPVSEAGVRALLMSHLSLKHRDEIGRFGLGFKSVLGVCESPEIFSQSVSFKFNPPELCVRMRELVSSGDRLPQLRTACPLDMGGEASRDPHLESFLSWATTVVRLRLVPGVHGRIREDLRGFPAEFLAFSPHITSLVLQAPSDGLSRQLTTIPKEDGVRIREGETEKTWLLFCTTIRTTDLPDAAHADMDARLRERDSLPLIWAVPTAEAQRQRGRFWAFSPTQTETTLQGILNAPWKTNSDRGNLLEGDFNAELIRRAAELVADNLQRLSVPDDPGRFLDALPASHDAGWADKSLASRLSELLKVRPCIPRVGGDFGVPSETKLRPEPATAEAVAGWTAEFAHLEPPAMAHRSVQVGDRGGRAKRLGSVPLPCDKWVEGVASARTPAASVAAIRLVDALLDNEKLEAWVARSLERTSFVLAQDGTLVPPDKTVIAFADGDAKAEAEHRCLVHDDIAADEDARRILADRFSIAPVTMEGAFRSLVARGSCGDAGWWNRLWKLSRKVDSGVAASILRNAMRLGSIRAKTLAGGFFPLGEILLPGAVVDETAEEEIRAVVIDMKYHAEDQGLLRELGASDRPQEGSKFGSRLLQAFQSDFAEPLFLQECRARPQSHCLSISPATLVGPLDPIEKLRGCAAVRMAEALLPYARRQPKCSMRHRNAGYPEVPMIGPLVWMLREHGWLATSLGPMPCRESLGRSLEEFADLLPIASCLGEDASLLGLPTAADAVTKDIWRKGIDRSLSYEGDDGRLTAFYVGAARSGNLPVPERLRCRLGTQWSNEPLKAIMVTADHGDAELLAMEGKPFLLATTQADVDALSGTWGLTPAGHGAMEFEPAREPEKATSLFPGLREVPGFPADAAFQQCSSLWLETSSVDEGRAQHPIDQAWRNRCLYYTGCRSAESLLTALVRHLPVSVPGDVLAKVLREADERSLSERLEAIRRAGSAEDKLLAAVGAAGLRRGIPGRHLAWLAAQGEASELRLATLAHSVYGVEVLKVYRDALAANGLRPPTHWTGGDDAVAFVRDLGFSEAYAGFPVHGRAPWEDVLGPVDLPPLHDYQERMCDEIRRFLDASPAGRGVLSLPTGAGKTRVAVESIIEWVKAKRGTGAVLWIAQTDELCEQSVQNWLQAWRAIGPKEGGLRVNRMWGSTNDRIRQPDKGSVLTVATFQTLDRRVQRKDVDWVFDADIVVIDEAHGAISPSYTRILGRLGLDQRNTARPLIGLTATPFRGDEDERETWRLAFRFEHRRFDKAFADAPDLYSQLQKRGVLAYAEHAEPLAGGDLELSDDELRQLNTFMQLPSSAESRLGADNARNERILDHLLSLPNDWPILLFSTSVEHAEDLAVKLNMMGVSACAISGETSSGRRRHAIEAFKRGELRVLTNYGVLTTGFDAPAIRAVYVTRPVYSPLLYQQMIGRGLRGPLNGGKERCLIVNVSDNIRQYGQVLAFHRFEHLWQS